MLFSCIYYKMSKSSIFQAVARGYSAQAAVKIAPASTGVSVAKLQSGAVVASVPSDSPISRVAVFINAGARHSTIPGMSHTFKVCATAGLSSDSATGFNMVRTLEQIGAVMGVESDREVTTYSSAVCSDNVDTVMEVLARLTSNNSYKYYEYPSARAVTRLGATLEVSSVDSVIDMAAKAAYRSQSLGNSVYVPLYNRGNITTLQINQFVESTHGHKGVLVVGSGVSLEVLEAGAAAMGVSGGGVGAAEVDTCYYGGDLRLETGGTQATVAVMGEGAKYGSSEAVALDVAAQLLGRAGPSIKYGMNASSPLGRALKEVQAKVQGTAVSYSDSGLFGFTLQASAADAPKAVSTLVSAVKNLTASEKDVQGAKARVKAALLEESLCSYSGVASMGRQLLLTGSYVPLVDALKAVDAVTPAAVTKAIAKAFSGKLTVAALGNVNDVPYSDTL